MSMRRKMASKRTASIILWILIGVFCVGIALWSVPNSTPGGPGNPASNIIASGTVAMVNGEKISSDAFIEEYTKKVGPNTTVTVNNVLDARKSVLQSLLDDSVRKQALKSLRVKVSDNEIETKSLEWLQQSIFPGWRKQARMQAEAEAKTAKEEAAKPKTNKDKDKKDTKEPVKPKTAEQHYAEQLANIMNMGEQDESKKVKDPTEVQFIKWFTDDFMAKDLQGMRAQKRLEYENRALGVKWAEQQQLPAGMYDEQYVKTLRTKEANASWIFITPDTDTPAGMAAAMTKIQAIRADIVKDPKVFSEKSIDSADVVSKVNGGALNWIRMGEKLPPVAEYYAFTMKSNELSPVILVNYREPYSGNKLGYAIVKHHGLRDIADLKDVKWDDDKAPEMYNQRARYESDLGEEYIALQRLQAKISSDDLEMAGYIAEIQNDRDKRDKVRKELLSNPAAAAKMPGIVQSALYYQVGITLPNMDERVDYLIKAVQGVENVAELHYELGRAYAGSTKPQKEKLALAQFTQAYDALQGSDMTTARNLQREFNQRKKDPEAAQYIPRIQKWVKDHENAQPSGGMPGGMTLPPPQ